MGSQIIDGDDFKFCCLIVFIQSLQYASANPTISKRLFCFHIFFFIILAYLMYFHIFKHSQVSEINFMYKKVFDRGRA
jgi:hypothetical protein